MFFYSLQLFKLTLKHKKHNPKTSPQSYKTEMKILPNPGLA